MLSLMNKCYRTYIACILFIYMRCTFGMLLLKHPVQSEVFIFWDLKCGPLLWSTLYINHFSVLPKLLVYNHMHTMKAAYKKILIGATTFFTLSLLFFILLLIFSVVCEYK